jgi:hypothetical protein
VGVEARVGAGTDGAVPQGGGCGGTGSDVSGCYVRSSKLWSLCRRRWWNAGYNNLYQVLEDLVEVVRVLMEENGRRQVSVAGTTNTGGGGGGSGLLQ